jgi:MFS family permease
MKHGNLLAAISAISVLGFAMGLTYPLLSLRLDAQDFSTAMIGLSTASQPLGTIAALAATPMLIHRFDAKPVAIACTLLTGLVLLIYPASMNFWLWCGLRFLQGLAFSVLFAISEAWVVEFAAGTHRSRALSLYMSAFAASMALGPMLIFIVGSAGYLPFVVGAVILLIVAVPIATIRSTKQPEATTHVPVAAIARQNPVLIASVAVFALIEIAALGMLPVYGVAQGLSEPAAALLASAFVSGPILLQYPLGWLADHFAKRNVLIAMAAISYAACLLLPVLLHGPGVWLLLALLGATTASLYTIALAVLGEKYQGNNLVAGTAVFSAVYGAGSLAGSGTTGIAMAAMGTAAFPYVLGATLVGLLIIVVAVEL